LVEELGRRERSIITSSERGGIIVNIRGTNRKKRDSETNKLFNSGAEDVRLACIECVYNGILPFVEGVVG